MKLLSTGILLLCLVILQGCRQADAQPTSPAYPTIPDSATAINSSHKQDDANSQQPLPSGSEMVWICKSGGAKRYHINRNCPGLKRCSHTIEKMTVKEAEAVGLTLCKYED
jgi:hypothetical protein